MNRGAFGRGLSPEAVNLTSQIQLESFRAAVSAATQMGTQYGDRMYVEGWQITIGIARQAGQYPVIYHARFVGE